MVAVGCNPSASAEQSRQPISLRSDDGTLPDARALKWRFQNALTMLVTVERAMDAEINRFTGQHGS